MGDMDVHSRVGKDVKHVREVDSDDVVVLAEEGMEILGVLEVACTDKDVHAARSVVVDSMDTVLQRRLDWAANSVADTRREVDSRTCREDDEGVSMDIEFREVRRAIDLVEAAQVVPE
jgi:hypothetical protein